MDEQFRTVIARGRTAPDSRNGEAQGDFPGSGTRRGPLTYLVTGGAGFIGSHVVDALVARGDRAIVLDDLSTGRLQNLENASRSGLVDVVEGSVLDGDLVDRCMQQADACLHLASAVGVQLVVDRPLESVVRNIRGTDTVLGSAFRHQRRSLFTSTSEIYGKNSRQALHEDADRIFGSVRRTRWGYALSKSVGEFLACQLHRERGADTVVVRLFNTVGARQRGAYGMVVPRLVRQALRGEPLTVYGDGAQTRCFLHVSDAVDAILRLTDASSATGGVFNIGTTTEVSVLDLAHRVLEHTGSDSIVTFVPYEEAFDDGFEELSRRIPVTSAIRDLTGWEPRRTLDDAIADAVAYEQAQAAAEPHQVLA